MVLVVNRAVTHSLPRRKLFEVVSLLRTEWPGLEVVETRGSIHAAANASGPALELALIPCGSANNIARSLGIPLDPLAAAELALYGRPPSRSHRGSERQHLLSSRESV
jgi:hypothetical protein